MSFSKMALYLVLFLSISISAQISGPNLILHLRFDGNSLSDSSTYNHTVINHETSFTTGVGDSGLFLDGTNQYLEVSHSINLEISGRLTMSMWYKHKTQNNTNSFYSLVEQSANEDGGHSRYGMWIIGDALWMCIEPDSCPGDGGLCQRCTSGNVSFVEDQWYHIAGTYDGQVLKIYVNGQLISEQDYGTDTGISVKPYPLTIGTDVYDPNPVYLKGSLDEIQLYDVALTAAQINQLYNEFNTASVSENSVSVSMYPNPASSIISIRSSLRFDTASVFNLNGQLIKTISIENEMVDIGFLNSGIYLMRLSEDGNSSLVKRLVVID
ncbi:LamG-like jellyroll fold domain-containing protein [uncultured Algibacter sp.]|uniref:LamG-like jellyroll fold domain-containing protein n=1 Tax=uncultured Algibacter sp. TaxID=298659 RepID=UPI002602A37E|nr:LamG-like jellyroll fold domain-containing protein [uncultured Algibacter sp.]